MAFNMASYIQPAFVVNMLAKPDIDGFNDRQMVNCPPEVDVKYNDLRVPMDSTLPPLAKIFRTIRSKHTNNVVYTLSDKTMRKFILYHDALVDRKLAIPGDENHRGVLSKARGQFARLAMVIHVLNQAVDEAQEIYTTEQAAVAASPSDWCTEVGEDAVAFAEVVMNHFISHKFCLMPTELVVTDDQNLSCLDSDLLQNHPRVLKRFLLDKSETLTPSDDDYCHQSL